MNIAWTSKVLFGLIGPGLMNELVVVLIKTV